MRPTPGAASHGEPLDTEAVCDRGNVRDAVHHPPAPVTIGTTVARPVVGDHARSDTRIRAPGGLTRKTRARRAMEREDWEPIRCTPLGHRQGPSIGRRHRLRPRRPSHDRIILRRVHGGKLVLVRGHLRTLAQPRISIPVLLFLAGRRSRRLRNLDSQCAAVSEVRATGLVARREEPRCCLGTRLHIELLEDVFEVHSHRMR